MRVLMLRRALLAAVIAALCVPAAATASPRMWVGFQDDWSFRWTPDREKTLDFAAGANATVIRTTVYWYRVAPTRPANASDPFDPAYSLEDLDEMIRGAQQRGIEVLLTVWGTPKWAGPANNKLPRSLTEFTKFTRALASRYSGRYEGYPYVRFFSLWNEPNRGIFLSPQFDSKGRSVAPALYAKLARAGYAGVKAGNSKALVAIGETASNGRDQPAKRKGLQDTHSPGKFAELLGKVRPRIKFDAWAHHPYPTSPSMKPTQKMRWPNVSLASLAKFEVSLDKWFAKRKTPVWITEYGHETKPDRHGITFTKQRDYLSQAFSIARKDARVQMFVWFILTDRSNVKWESGLVTSGGSRKPGFSTFSSLAQRVDARNATVDVRGQDPLVRFSALPMAYYAPPGSPVGVSWELQSGSEILGHGAPQAPLDADGWVGFRPDFTPVPGVAYTLIVRANNEAGVTFTRVLTLIGK
jgi:aryl-phospho-beta-D-glucosidase BglC (GH1 family)